jgi:hypothetical protein
MRVRVASALAAFAVVVCLGLTAGPALAGNLLDDAKGALGSSKSKPSGSSSSESGGVGKAIENITKGSSTSSTRTAALSDSDIGLGLRDALRVGTERVVGTLGRTDGFNLSDVHIPLPGTLGKVQKVLKKVGQTGLADDLELRLNRAAEIATPLAKTLFGQAIEDMTLQDARGILTGPDDSATQYFRGKMSKPLVNGMRPIVDDALAEAGAIQAYDRMMGAYREVPLVPDVKADLTSYVLEKATDGIFLYIGREEAAIRHDPVKRTTSILQKVFGAL